MGKQVEIPNQYVKKGRYYVGKYGACAWEPNDFINATEDTIASIDIPEGSVIEVYKYNTVLPKCKNPGIIQGPVYEVVVVNKGWGETPPDAIEADENYTYITTDHALFGSLNVKFIEEILYPWEED